MKHERGWWPRKIRSDNGDEFKGEVAKMFEPGAPWSKIKRQFTKPYHPNDNAIVERSNRNVRDIIRKHYRLVNRQDGWKNLLPEIEHNLNTRWNSAINAVPIDIHQLGNKDALVIKARELIQERAQKTLEKRGIENIIGKFKIGDRVRIAAHKYHTQHTSTEGKMKKVTDFSKEVFKVAEIGPDWLKVEGDDTKYYSYQIQKIPKKTVSIKSTKEFYKDKIYPTIETVPNPDNEVIKKRDKDPKTRRKIVLRSRTVESVD